MSSSMDDNSQISEMKVNLQLLQDIAFFATLPLKAIKLLAFVAERQHFSINDILFEEGDDYGRAFLILSGELTLMKRNESEEKVVQQFHEGDLLGTFSLFGTMPSLFLLKASSDCTVLTVTREHFSKIQEQFPEATAASMKALLREVYQWERKNLTKGEICCLNQTGATIL